VRGAANFFNAPPVHLHLLSARPTDPPADFCFSTFSGVSRQGEFKNTIKKHFCKMKMQKVHVEKKSKTFAQNFDVSFPRFFCFIEFSMFLSDGDGSSKTLQKTFYNKNRVEKLLQKNRPKVQNRLFLDFFLNHVFGRFSVRGVQKHHQKNIGKINFDPKTR
jgi:hypothetical protein